ncbi:hypothetical protein D0T50_08925 [Bacteroides sp. 214]|uniref:dienelactone hydrolase family protein n=1 Tax=Bacteroides sp. 214 TaxID=2302935 RepID=UPI0013D12D7D|nr:alpha/beta hydrolase family protein [Bacteroides sp. 214]NDW13014.1 hypothetical protein [Bacteroides sp. 214]
MRTQVTTLLILLSAMLFAQEQVEKPYGVEKSMPVFYQELKNSLTFPLAWQNNQDGDFSAWRTTARETLTMCLENILPAPADYEMEITATEQRDGYRAQKISFNLSAWYRVPAYLLIPDGEGPFPALVMLHDHGAHFSIGKEKVVKPFGVSAEVMEDSRQWQERCYDSVPVSDYFAAKGYVVLVVDALFWGERGRKEGVNYDIQQALASNLMQMGTSWGGVITMDDVRSTEFLASLPQVKADKIGCIGFSMGGHRSWMLSAATDKIAASASLCWMNTTETLMTMTNNQNKGGSAYSMIIPGIRRFMDYPHVASIACPKPSLFFNGTQDKLFPVEGVESAYATLREVWDSQGVGDRLVTKIWEEKHFMSKAIQQESLEFFDKWLK